MKSWKAVTVVGGVLALSLAGCGGGSVDDEQSKQAVQKRIKDDAGAARKQLDQVQGVTMKGGELSGGDAQGRPLWRISAKEIKVFNQETPESSADKDAASEESDVEEGDNEAGDGEKADEKDKLKQLSAQPRRAELVEARAMIYKEGKLDSTFRAPRAIVNYTADGARISFSGGIQAQSGGGWTGKRGVVSVQAPNAEVNVKSRRMWASGGVRLVQGQGAEKIYAAASQMQADASLKTTRLAGQVKASSPQGKFSANTASWNWETQRASAMGAVTATHDGTTITGTHLDADAANGRGVLRGGVRASGEQGKASANRVEYDWKNHKVTASGGVTLQKDDATLTASLISADDKFDAAVASGGVTMKKGDTTLRAASVQTRGKGEAATASGSVVLTKGDATLRAGRVETQNKGAVATASGGVTVVRGDAQISASRATAYGLGEDNSRVTATGNVRVKRGDLIITAGAAQASGLKDKSTLRVVASDGVYAKSSDGAVRAGRATYGGGQIVAAGGVTLFRDGHELSGTQLVCDDQFTTATLTGNINGALAKGGGLTAGKMVYRKGQGVTATNGVRARRGALRLAADKLTSTPDGSHLVLTGNVVVTNEDGARILSREARYDKDAQKVYATGDVYVQDPKRGLRQRGRKLVADLNLKQITLSDVSGSGKMDVFKDKQLF